MRLSTIYSSCFLCLSLQAYADTPDVIPFLSDISSANTVYRLVNGDSTDIVTTRFIRPSIEIWNYPKLSATDKRLIKKVINRFGHKYLNNLLQLEGAYSSEAEIYRKLFIALVDPYVDSGLLREAEQEKLEELKQKIDRLDDKQIIELISRYSIYERNINDEACNASVIDDYVEYDQCGTINVEFGTGVKLIPKSTDPESVAPNFEKNFRFSIELEIGVHPNTNKKSRDRKNAVEYYVRAPNLTYNCPENLENNWQATLFTMLELMPEFVEFQGIDEKKQVVMRSSADHHFWLSATDGACWILIEEEH